MAIKKHKAVPAAARPGRGATTRADTEADKGQAKKKKAATPEPRQSRDSRAAAEPRLQSRGRAATPEPRQSRDSRAAAEPRLQSRGGEPRALGLGCQKSRGANVFRGGFGVVRACALRSPGLGKAGQSWAKLGKAGQSWAKLGKAGRARRAKLGARPASQPASRWLRMHRRRRFPGTAGGYRGASTQLGACGELGPAGSADPQRVRETRPGLGNTEAERAKWVRSPFSARQIRPGCRSRRAISLFVSFSVS
jgi:hypothetical protein